MSDAPVNGTGEMHAALKTALAELLPDMLRDHAGAPVAQVPAPPVAQTLRPSTWHPSQQAPDPAGGTAPAVAPAAVLAGRVRFSLSASAASSSPAPAVGGSHRIDRGAVTERVIERAAAEGSALVLGPKAVLTPLGRDRARALGVTIQREAAC